jgi:alpha-methylacyl-CoA racemase
VRRVPSISKGPLAGVRVVEFAGIGPGPHGCMLLSDLGAQVLRITRAGGAGWPNPIVDRGRHSLELDLRSDSGRARAIEAMKLADVAVEGFRPGVMERLGLGPQEMLVLNPRLIYGRITGWGQSGALAKTAGHDINFIALSGALQAITGSDGQPVAPLNLVGDFGGGSLYLALGIVAALWERERSGQGQVVDAAIVDGVASMMTTVAGLVAAGRNALEPEQNILGGRAPFYRCYECADGKYLSVGPIEPPFYAQLLEKIGASAGAAEAWSDRATWPEQVSVIARLLRAKTRDQWCEILQGSDACFAPVLTYAESLQHPHLAARATYVDVAGVKQAAPTPRFSRTPGAIQATGDGNDLLDQWRAAAVVD